MFWCTIPTAMTTRATPSRCKVEQYAVSQDPCTHYEDTSVSRSFYVTISKYLSDQQKIFRNRDIKWPRYGSVIVMGTRILAKVGELYKRKSNGGALQDLCARCWCRKIRKPTGMDVFWSGKQKDLTSSHFHILGEYCQYCQVTVLTVSLTVVDKSTGKCSVGQTVSVSERC